MGESYDYTEEYILKNGTNFDNLWFSSSTDEILDAPEDEGGLPFSGLAYEYHSNKNLAYYCFYSSGFQHGLNREFYKSGLLKKEETYIHGFLFGKSTAWYENGQILSISEMELSIPLSYQKWDAAGKLVKSEKLEENPDLFNLELLLTRRERFHMMNKDSF